MQPITYQAAGDSSVFETLTIFRRDLSSWPRLLRQISLMVESSQIKIVDITQDSEQLIITYRMRSSAKMESIREGFQDESHSHKT